MTFQGVSHHVSLHVSSSEAMILKHAETSQDLQQKVNGEFQRFVYYRGGLEEGKKVRRYMFFL